MIFTFGRTSGYDEHIRTTENPEKLGRHGVYSGGAVWKTQEEAQAFVDSMPNKHCPDWYAKDFSVYGAVADWENDVYNGELDAPWHSLKHNARLVKL